MAVMPVKDFRLLTDFAAVRWGPTLRYNILRAICASCVMAIVLSVVYANGSPIEIAKDMSATDPLRFLLDPLIYPVFLIFMFYPVLLIRKIYEPFGNFLLLGCLLLSIVLVTIGDPLLYVIYLIRPTAVPVTPPLLSLVPFILLVDLDVFPGTKVYS